jgi:toluene monooxygenase electron transfer component
MKGGPPAFQIAIEGQAQPVTCCADDTLLGAILRSGAGVAYECNAGGCGSCKFTLLSGSVAEQREDAPGLSPRDRRKGTQLACICRPQSDCAIRIRHDPDYEPKIKPLCREVRLVARSPLTHDLWQFRFQSNRPADFLPGQYAKFELPGVAGWRCYSMSNIANADGQWDFHIKRVPGGEATSVLFDEFGIGDRMVLDAPYSIAHLREATRRPSVCIAGGSGLAPMVSILRGLGASPEGAANAVLYYGARGQADVVAEDLFAGIPGFDPKHQYRPVVSSQDGEEAGTWDGPVGMVHEFVASDLGETWEDADFYIAGPPPMVDAVRRHLVLERKIQIGRLHYDRFF